MIPLGFDGKYSSTVYPVSGFLCSPAESGWHFPFRIILTLCIVGVVHVQVTDEGVKKLQQALPNCEIHPASPVRP